uniref:Pre-mRNA-splicing factor SPF27 n=1 Tax=Caenorhabditis tropicalis TaxID=1561998 RepID=A0A1I7UWA0_9PELO
MTERFEVEISEDQVPIYRSIIEYLTALSVDSAYFLRYLRSLKDIADTGNYENFMKWLVRFSQLSRDNKWRDVWNSIKEASDIVSSYEDELIAPFKGLKEIVTGSYEEIFLSMKLLLEGGNVESKCKFIKEFFTGLKDRDTVLEEIGIQVSEMHDWIDSTEYVDALVDVLNAADTYPNLNRLLEFHGKYTTVDKKPLESMDLIDNFIRYLEQSGRWNKKV